MPSHSCAYFLVAHGSRDTRSIQAFQQLTANFIQAIAISPTAILTEVHPRENLRVGSGTLEFHPQSLAEQLVHFCHGLPRRCHLKVLPLLLLPGNHVCQDIPTAIAQAQTILGSDYTLECLPHLGSHPQIQTLVQTAVQGAMMQGAIMQEAKREPAATPWILLGHGSQRHGANPVLVQLAHTLGMHPAFWVGTPSLEEQVLALRETAPPRIGIVPYFLFPGRITDAIAEQAQQLELQFKSLPLTLLRPLVSTPALIHLLVDLCLPTVAE